MEYVIIYAIGYVISVVISAGWQFAYFDGEFPGRPRQQLSFAIGWSLFGMVLWPVTLIMSYFLSCMAERGWRLPRSIPKRIAD